MVEAAGVAANPLWLKSSEVDVYPMYFTGRAAKRPA